MLECPAMVRRVPALLFLLYVALDFANPLMPGAVNFDAETSVEAARLERVRSCRVAEVAMPAAGPPPVVPGLAPAPESHPARPAPPRPTRRLAAPPRSGPTAESPSPPGDDA
jgi:hypothetical protein